MTDDGRPSEDGDEPGVPDSDSDHLDLAGDVAVDPEYRFEGAIGPADADVTETYVAAAVGETFRWVFGPSGCRPASTRTTVRFRSTFSSR
jgi:hypothetical protein